MSELWHTDAILETVHRSCGSRSLNFKTPTIFTRSEFLSQFAPSRIVAQHKPKLLTLKLAWFVSSAMHRVTKKFLTKNTFLSRAMPFKEESKIKATYYLKLLYFQQLMVKNSKNSKPFEVLKYKKTTQFGPNKFFRINDYEKPTNKEERKKKATFQNPFLHFLSFVLFFLFLRKKITRLRS